MAQDPYSALASGLQQGMNMAMAYKQYQAQQEQQKLDNALTGMKLHMTLLDPNMPKAANKVGLQGLTKMLSDPTLSKAMGLNIPEGFDPGSIADDTKGLATIYKDAGPIFQKVKKGEIDKGTALTLFGNMVNEYAATRSQEQQLMKELREELGSALKIPEKIEEQQAMIGAGLAETPGQAREANRLSGLQGDIDRLNLGITETPGQRRAGDTAEALRRERALVGAGLRETPEQARLRNLEKEREGKNYVAPDDALRRISAINQARVQIEKGDKFTPMLLALKPELAESFQAGDTIPPDIKLGLQKAWKEEESYLRRFAPRDDLPRLDTKPSHGGKRIVRTGTAPDGTRVAEYSDGTIGPIK